MLTALLLTTALAAPTPAPTAAQVLERAEKALLAPDRLGLDAHIRAKGSFDADIKTTWRWETGRRLRVDIDGRLLRAPASARFVSTGEYMQWPGYLAPVSPDLDRGSRLILLRLGASFNAIRIASGTLPDGLDGTGHHFARVIDVTVGDRERVGTRRCLPLRFTMLVADSPIGTATLWIDAKTYLPVKRRMKVAFNGGTMTVDETYRRVGSPKRPYKDELFQLY